MFKVKRLTLDNGLNVILINDKTKNAKSAYLSVNVGGFVKDFKMDNKEYHLNYGIAHFLEHYLIENSIYGNVMEIFSSDYVESNGFTAPNRTVFYINTVHDFEDNLVKLLNIVNNPNFTEDKINSIKVPVLREIDKALDNPYRKVHKYSFEKTFKEIPYDVTLGEHKDIEKISLKDIKDFHNAFYNAKNELLVVSGNINEKEILELINNTYSTFKNNDHIVEKYEYKEVDEVVEKECDTTGIEDFVKVTYKINVKDIKPIDKDKLSYYLSFLIFNNFSERSELFKYIIDNKISSFAITNNVEFGLSKDYLVITFIMYTDKFDIAKKLILDKMNNIELDKEQFKIWKNKHIITQINSLENFNTVVRDYMDNIYLYDHYDYDDIDFVKNLSLEECNKLINKLNFNNVNVTICKKE
jgi:predicted Zn-dependent peptidase